MSSYNGLYLVGNYPDKKTFIEAAVKGAQLFDFLEVGIPFSDPVADGPVIVKAAFEALKNNETIDSILDSIDEIKKRISKDKKIYFMNYANTAHAATYAGFCKKCSEHGVSGMIIPDIPLAESGPLKAEASKLGLEYVDFITPESSSSQIEETVKNSTGFVYAVSMRGITGQKLAFDEETKVKIKFARDLGDVKVVIGFGIRTAADAKSALEIADGFIMGTEPVKRIGESLESFNNFIDELSKAL